MRAAQKVKRQKDVQRRSKLAINLPGVSKRVGPGSRTKCPKCPGPIELSKVFIPLIWLFCKESTNS